MYKTDNPVIEPIGTADKGGVKKQERIFGLDILRSIAILTVVIGHIFYVIPNHVDPHTVRLFFWDGVNIFYTLSGFLIGGILLRQLSREQVTFKNLLRFLQNRWWRTLPAYLFVLIALMLCGMIVTHNPWSQYLPFFLFLQNIKTGALVTFGESWSLAVEEWFYLTTPLMLFILCRFLPLRKAVPVIVTAVFALATAIRIYKVHHYHIDTYSRYVYDIMMTVPSRIDAVMFGVLGAYLSFYKFKVWTNYKNLLFYLGVAGFVFNHYLIIYMDLNAYILYFHKQVELFCVLMTMPKLSTLRQGKGKLARLVTYISLTSYSIYLVHGSVYLAFFRPWLPEVFWVQLIVYLTWAFLGSYLLYNTVEKWGMRQREKINKRHTVQKELHIPENLGIITTTGAPPM